VLTNVETAEEFDSNEDEAHFLGNFPSFVFEGQKKITKPQPVEPGFLQVK
jgi:hypothetical protein